MATSLDFVEYVCRADFGCGYNKVQKNVWRVYGLCERAVTSCLRQYSIHKRA